MKAGPLNTLLTVYRPVAADNGNPLAASSTRWERCYDTHAERVRVSARALAEGSEQWVDYAPTYRIRLTRRPLADGWRVAERGDVAGRQYQITNIITDRAAGMVTIQCERVNL